MKLRRVVRPAIAGALLLFGVGATAPRSDPPPAVLALIERGQWQFKEKSGDVRKLCLGAAARAVVQLGHGAAACEQFVLSQDSRSAEVRYTCAGHGQGRTTVTVETPRLIRIETQGVADGSPFDLEYEGRKLGGC